MDQSGGKLKLYLAFAVLVMGVVVAQVVWVRAALAVLCGGVLLMTALRAPVAATDGPVSGAPAAGRKPSTGEERRRDETVREQIQALLDLIREFYNTCHMVAVGQLEPSKAKAKAQDVERKLDEMMARMLKKIEAEDDAAQEGE